MTKSAPPPENIPDCYLFRAIGACCTDDSGRLLLSKAVRELIARCAPNDRPTANEISQERRRGFLDELGLITGRTLPPFEPIQAAPLSPSPQSSAERRRWWAFIYSGRARRRIDRKRLRAHRGQRQGRGSQGLDYAAGVRSRPP